MSGAKLCKAAVFVRAWSHSSTIQHKTTVTLFPRYNNKLEMLLYVNTKTSFFPTVNKSSTGFQWFYLSNTVSLSNSWDFDEPNRHRGSLLELMLVTDKELNQSKGNRWMFCSSSCPAVLHSLIYSRVQLVSFWKSAPKPFVYDSPWEKFIYIY